MSTNLKIFCLAVLGIAGVAFSTSYPDVVVKAVVTMFVGITLAAAVFAAGTRWPDAWTWTTVSDSRASYSARSPSHQLAGSWAAVILPVLIQAAKAGGWIPEDINPREAGSLIVTVSTGLFELASNLGLTVLGILNIKKRLRREDL